MYGPFISYQEEDDYYKFVGKYLYPTRFGKYEEREFYVRIPKSNVENISTRNGHVYVDLKERNPWLETLAVDKKMFMPQVRENEVENVVPVATIEREKKGNVILHRFYGYYVVFKNGVPVEVKGAGIYERHIPVELTDKEPAVPAILVKDLPDFTKEEFQILLENTPPELLVPLHRAGRGDIVAGVIAEIIRNDPRKITTLPKEIVESYILTERQDLVVKLAMMETTPMMLKVLIEELRSLGYDAEKLSYLYMRYREEKQEDKQLEKVIEDGRKQLEEIMKRRREEEARKTLEYYKDAIKEVLGITFPIIVTAGIYASRPITYVQKTETLSEEQIEKEEVSA